MNFRTICDTYNPAEPSNIFDSFYSSVNPTKSKPLVILLDEIDVIISRIHNNEILLHEKYTTQIYNKVTWNLFFDKLNMGLYPNVIVILCSNMSPTDIDKMDKCYLRKNRIHIISEMKSVY